MGSLGNLGNSPKPGVFSQGPKPKTLESFLRCQTKISQSRFRFSQGQTIDFSKSIHTSKRLDLASGSDKNRCIVVLIEVHIICSPKLDLQHPFPRCYLWITTTFWAYQLGLSAMIITVISVQMSLKAVKDYRAFFLRK